MTQKDFLKITGFSLSMGKMIIYVKVKPGMKEESIEKVENNRYVVCLKERAEDGKANKRLINLLAKKLGVNFRAIKIKNPRSRDKIIEVKD